MVVGPGWGMPRMVAQQVSGEKVVAAAQLPGIPWEPEDGVGVPLMVFGYGPGSPNPPRGPFLSSQVLLVTSE